LEKGRCRLPERPFSLPRPRRRPNRLAPGPRHCARYLFAARR
jgi:hypothetical protein